MKLIRSKEWWLRLAQAEPDCDCAAGAPDDIRGPHNGYQTRSEYLASLDMLAKLKARLFSGGDDGR